MPILSNAMVNGLLMTSSANLVSHGTIHATKKTETT
jgi:hypothetical protein